LNLNPQAFSVNCSDFVLGYFLQLSGLKGWIEQYDLPLALSLRKGQTLGNWQQAPQLRHRPFLFFATGRTEVNILFIFAK